jgi:hypothetical protein
MVTRSHSIVVAGTLQFLDIASEFPLQKVEALANISSQFGGKSGSCSRASREMKSR